MKVVETKTKDEIFLSRLSSMCTDCEILENNNEIIVQGEPTEVAIVNYGLKLGQNKDKLYNQMPRINEIPFDSNRKMMTTIHKIDTGYRVITKGAPDVLLDRCKNVNKRENSKTKSRNGK